MLKTVFLQNTDISATGCVMLLGGFDGLHAGHKTLVESAKAYGLPIIATTIFGGKTEEELFTLSERESLFRAAGVDILFELPFAEIKDMEAEVFATLLTETFNPKAFVCGDDFRFGKGAKGDPETLERATRVRVEAKTLLTRNGEKVSSSTVKKYLTAGEIEKANMLLDEPFFLLGEVECDRGVGKTIGFPTANIAYPTQKSPLKKGVYETRVILDGKTYQGVTNFGARPTFGDEKIVTETHILGFDGDLYGKRLQIRFLRYLRDIQKFDSAEMLVEQLRKDVRRVKNDD